MTHSVPPPEPPAIVQQLLPKALPAVGHRVNPPLVISQSVTAKPPSSPKTVRSLSPKPANVNAAKDAALLGPEVKVGYPVEQLEIANFDDTGLEAAAPVSANQKTGDRRQETEFRSLNSEKIPLAPPASENLHLLNLPTKNSPQPNLARSQKQPISPFRPSTSVVVNKRLVSQVAAPETTQSDRPDLNNASDQEVGVKQDRREEFPLSPCPRVNKAVSVSTTFCNCVSELLNFQPVELDFQAPTSQAQLPASPIFNQQNQPATGLPIQPSQPNQTTPQPPAQPPQPSQPPGTAPVRRRIVEVNSDRQEYDARRQIVTAEGNVLVRLEDAVLDADRVEVSLPNLIAVGEGNVAFTRGQQVIRGQRFTYNIVQNTGDIQNGGGEIFIPTASSDFSNTLATDVTTGSVLARPPSDRFTANQPLQNVTSPGGIGITVGGGRRGSNIPAAQEGGQIRRLRFQANQIDFYPEGWQASGVRITNDPFSPPELELRADRVTLTRETPFRDRIRTTRQRLVFDQGFSIPIPRNQAVIDRNQRDVSPGLAQFGYDAADRGGLYIERGFPVINSNAVQLNLKPQFYVQKSLAGNAGGPFDPSVFGLKANARGNFGPKTGFTGNAVFTSLDLNDIEDNLRARLQLQQLVGTRLPHTVALEYAYRERIYNGTLGYRTVQSSIGGQVTSPVIPLGKTGINLSYQTGYQYINADSDRLELLKSARENNRVSLGRFQSTAALSRGFVLWQGKGLPATAKEGLRYTPAPVVPYFLVFAGVTGTSSFYSNGDNQSTLIGTVGLEGQFGHFSRPFFDYTRFNISYSEGFRSGISPFLFDRAADTRVLGFGITQQIFGPFRLGFQTAINLDNKESLSTDYILEYSRRTYGIVLRYNPEQEIGSIGFRLSDFNWFGSTDPLSDYEVRPVVNGVRR